jgi:RNA polymerase sigma-B factor
MTQTTAGQSAAPPPHAEDDARTSSHANSIYELLLRYYRSRDPALRDRVVLAHLGLVRYLAGKFANRGEPIEDLVQVGTIGLIHAVDRFDPTRGNKFSTYAAPTIVGEIKRYFRDKSWNLRVPRRLQELNNATSKAAESLTGSLGRSPTILEIASAIGASEEETLEAIELGNAYETVSLDSRLDGHGDANPLSLAEFIGDEDEDLLDVSAFDDVRQALRGLDEREQAIIALRFFNDLSQFEVAQRLRISQMHVSRLQHKALRKLKALLAKT